METHYQTAKHLDFSLFYFGNADVYEDENEKYKLLIDGAKYGDQHGFTAVWTPERHFSEFAGLYPSPAVLGATLAAHTKHIGIRAGSVVIPLHHPLRVAEDWSVVDNLSGGRAGIACASGWQANDFVLAADNYANRYEVMYKNIASIQQLWKGDAIPVANGNGEIKATRIFPKPLQPKLPMWITTNGNPASFRYAGKEGYNILTNFWGSSPDELGANIALYREAYQANGHPEGQGKIVLMLHAYIAASREAAYEKAREPLIRYLRSSVGLLKHNAASGGSATTAAALTPEEEDKMLEYSFYRYASGSSLVGSHADALEVLHKVSQLGVDEIACLLDFGIDYTAIMESLDHLTAVKNAYQDKVTASVSSSIDFDIPAGF
ncbi:MupA/Atu3671 family FMN-dependent luciferase-like monooxygenase [Chitinophaga nivalis]|uniref:LLM class flavin-dependent oxidoreductase n=1 Tax=Chitinophaga nivalis TaxID=2991709 RepID=A0ABT3IPA5_9BACT|nr:MupA/Atu3671 family FMN-dependent luciferase-like monooxygenase [Chitinophaga nivalis]MCW3464520.1 LLM class flavin-dependent oxidoreductase [Chitinophaga nivalis]MCW3485789.1 LLM class flavin-dependent oxidoreductase [Chitinophaga nivalis]